MILYSTIALALGFLLDLLLGDPPHWPHLVRLIGRLIQTLENMLYPLRNKRLAGTLLVWLCLLITGTLTGALLFVAWQVSPWLYLMVESVLCWQCLAFTSLKKESGKVYERLAQDDLPGARQAVSMIVGRDPQALDAQGVTRAAVETVAENASDGVIAPLFYLLLGGAPFGVVYKAVNTMDSMIGYKNERYVQFGRSAALLDDLFNFVPARISALLMLVGTALCRMDQANAFHIWRRDRFKHASPNSAQTEAVMAGALGVQLAGDASYFGRRVEKPSIGDARRVIEPQDILRSHRLLDVTVWIMFILVLFLRGVIHATF